MTYQNTARAFAQTTTADSFAAAARLPMSDWAESRRDTMTPQTIAANHILHVQGCAAELRNAINLWEADVESEVIDYGDMMSSAASRLLAAIGEGE